jgi:predicted aspartyl protease
LIYADIPIWSKKENRYLDARVLIDTGANVTSFSDIASKTLGFYDNSKTAKVKTASGVVSVCVLKIPRIMLGDTELVDIEAHSHSHLDSFNLDGIIGMNILRLFNFNINFDEQLMTLNKRF